MRPAVVVQPVVDGVAARAHRMGIERDPRAPPRSRPGTRGHGPPATSCSTVHVGDTRGEAGDAACARTAVRRRSRKHRAGTRSVGFGRDRRAAPRSRRRARPRDPSGDGSKLRDLARRPRSRSLAEQPLAAVPARDRRRRRAGAQNTAQDATRARLPDSDDARAHASQRKRLELREWARRPRRGEAARLRGRRRLTRPRRASLRDPARDRRRRRGGEQRGSGRARARLLDPAGTRAHAAPATIITREARRPRRR